jgi:hypothetical protein
MKSGQVQEESAQPQSLDSMTVGQLQAKFLEVFSYPTNSRNKPYLKIVITRRLDERTRGSVVARINRLIEEARREREGIQTSKCRDPRLPPPGTTLTRDYQGNQVSVLVLEDDFEYEGQRYPTLSEVTNAITKARWNGYLFWKEALESGSTNS